MKTRVSYPKTSRCTMTLIPKYQLWRFLPLCELFGLLCFDLAKMMKPNSGTFFKLSASLEYLFTSLTIFGPFS